MDPSRAGASSSGVPRGSCSPRGRGRPGRAEQGHAVSTPWRRSSTSSTIWPRWRPESTRSGRGWPPRPWGRPPRALAFGSAVADSGLDLTHPDLPSSLIDAYDVTTGEGREAWSADVSDTVPGSGHGTHVTGTICGSGGLSGGRYQGVAPGVSLAFYKVGDLAGIDEADIIEAIERARSIGCKVMNLSLGGRRRGTRMVRDPWPRPSMPPIREACSASVRRGTPEVRGPMCRPRSPAEPARGPSPTCSTTAPARRRPVERSSSICCGAMTAWRKTRSRFAASISTRTRASRVDTGYEASTRGTEGGWVILTVKVSRRHLEDLSARG